MRDKELAVSNTSEQMVVVGREEDKKKLLGGFYNVRKSGPGDSEAAYT